MLGEIRDYDSIGRSRYDAMNLSYRKRMSKNFTINASYVLSRGLAYNGGSAAFGNGPTDELNWFAPHDFGPTPADETHRITISGVFNLPLKITFSPIMQWATGRPYSTLEGVNDTLRLRRRTGEHAYHRAEQRSDQSPGDRPATPTRNCSPAWRPAPASRCPTTTSAARISSSSTRASAGSSTSRRK